MTVFFSGSPFMAWREGWSRTSEERSWLKRSEEAVCFENEQLSNIGMLP